MVHVLKEYTEDGEDYIVIKLFTACCKDTLTFKKLTQTTYFDMQEMEEASEGWNNTINKALDNLKEMENKSK
jgi:hypothetical protein